MSIEIITSNGHKRFSCVDKDYLTVDLIVNWPGTVCIFLSGKDLEKDTQVDQHGNILANKYVKLKGVKVLNMELIEPAIYRFCNFRSSDMPPKSDIFWDRNGIARLDFNEKNPMRWNLRINNMLNFAHG